MSTEKPPKLTVITVCRNEPNIERTCESIVSQTWQDFEWIVVDGASTDGTLDVLEKYKARIDIFISEPDTGIYDAMNKGILLAHGEFLNFMNGGDAFANVDVLKKVFSSETKQYSKYGVLYGDIFVVQREQQRYQAFPREYPLSKFTEERWSVNHQSSFIRTSLFRKYGVYDVRFKINADFHRFVQWRKLGIKFFHLEIVVAIFDLGGLSQQNRVANDAEKESAISLNFTRKERRKIKPPQKLIWRCLLFNKLELLKISENYTRAKRIFSLLGVPVLGFLIERKFNRPAQMTTNALWRGLKETLAKEGQIFRDLSARIGKLKAISLPAESLHQEVFPKYRNCHVGEEVVIVGAGPSLDDYIPIPGAIHIGVNKTFLCEKFSLDYLFIQDYFEDIQDAADVYHPKTCKKFYGYHAHGQVRGIPTLSADRANAERYFFEDVPMNDPAPFPFPPDISRACLGTFSSIIFPALQFALWTHPKRIYLVGCDCSSLGHCGSITSKTSTKMKFPLATERLLYGWQRMKDFIEKFYPDIEVVSINPVGLKGMFVDMEQ